MKFKTNDKIVCMEDGISLAAFEQCEFDALPERGKVYCVENSRMCRYSNKLEAQETLDIVGMKVKSIKSGVTIPWQASMFMLLSESKQQSKNKNYD